MLLEEQDVLVRVLAMHFFTLYELWEWFVDHTGHDCDIEVRAREKACTPLASCILLYFEPYVITYLSVCVSLL